MNTPNTTWINLRFLALSAIFLLLMAGVLRLGLTNLEHELAEKAETQVSQALRITINKIDQFAEVSREIGISGHPATFSHPYIEVCTIDCPTYKKSTLTLDEGRLTYGDARVVTYSEFPPNALAHVEYVPLGVYLQQGRNSTPLFYNGESHFNWASASAAPDSFLWKTYKKDAWDFSVVVIRDLSDLKSQLLAWQRLALGLWISCLLWLIASAVLFYRVTRPVQELLTTLKAGASQVSGTLIDRLWGDFKLVALHYNELLTDLRLKSRKLEENSNRFQSLSSNVKDLIARTDAFGLTTYASPSLELLTGYTPAELLGQSLSDLIHPDDVGAVKSGFKRVLEQESTEIITFRFFSKSGQTRWFESQLTLIDDGSGKEVLSVSRDVTERQQLHSHLEHLARFDSLTGLANRATLTKSLQKCCTGANESFAVLVLDLDKFKQINDTLGHIVGDRLLIEIGSRLTKAVRQEDLVARMGGDEFVIVARGLFSEKDVQVLATKIIDAVSAPLQIDAQTLYPKTSIGVAFYPDHGRDGTTLIAHADAAMYESKAKGGSVFSIYTSGEGTTSEKSIEEILGAAMANNDLHLEFQPVINREGKTVAAECLVRLTVDNVCYSPAEFIPVAEQSGLIIPLGDWILQEALRSVKAWQQEGFNIPVSVNLSRRQFNSGTLIQTINQSLKNEGLDPNVLEIELTESMLMEDCDYVLRILTALKNTGVLLALDDFGTGYSSMSYLKFMPLDRLKIDKSFVRELAEDKGEAMVASIVSLGHNLGLKVTAEGVESGIQEDCLLRLGVDSLQGFYYTKPLPLDQFIQHLHG